ncbi:MAG: hypothetical protein ACFCVE_10560 [Phycisphaerae bacterium]
MWAAWWDWELDTSNPHLGKRMRERGFNEVELRIMIIQAERWWFGETTRRYEVQTVHAGKRWHVILEPDFDEEVIIVVTAYPVE